MPCFPQVKWTLFSCERHKLYEMKHSFNGSLVDYDLDNICTPLIALIQIILGGTSIKSQTTKTFPCVWKS